MPTNKQFSNLLECIPVRLHVLDELHQMDDVSGGPCSMRVRHTRGPRLHPEGLISEQTAGLVIAQRTVIRIQSDDRHEIDLYFTPPGRAEMLIDHSIYTRMQK